MANIKQQRKRIKTARREHLENLRFKSRIKTAFKSLTVTAQEDKEKAVQLGLELISLIDRAASRGVLHANNAARKKSQVTAIVELPEGTSKPASKERKAAEGNLSKTERISARHQARAEKKKELKEKQKAKAETAAEAAKAKPAKAKAEPAPAAAEAEEEAAAEEAPAEEAAAEEAVVEEAVEEAAAEEVEAEEAAAEEPAAEPAEEEASAEAEAEEPPAAEESGDGEETPAEE